MKSRAKFEHVAQAESHGKGFSTLVLSLDNLVLGGNRHYIAEDFDDGSNDGAAESTHRNLLSYMSRSVHGSIFQRPPPFPKKKSSEIFIWHDQRLLTHATLLAIMPLMSGGHMTDESGKTAAYVSWVTFKNALDRLSKTMPNRIDKTVFPGYSGGTLIQLLPALKFLGLTLDDGTPTATLKALVGKDELGRRADLRKIFEQSYPRLFALDLSKATSGQVSEEMSRSHGVTGSTLKKAVRFFLLGALELDVQLSDYLIAAKGAATGNGGSRKKLARKQKSVAESASSPLVASPASGGTTKVVNLKSGGTLTVSASADFFAMSASDRKIVFSLIEQLEEYERETQATAIPPGQGPAEEGAEE